MIDNGEPTTQPKVRPIPRRTLIGILGIGPRHSHAQAPAKAPRVGWLSGPAASGRESPLFKAVEEGLRELGYVSGQTVIVDFRTPGDKVEEYPDLAVRLVAEGVDVLLASNPYSLGAVTKATTTIPIVGVDLESDPVARGWVVSVGRPGRNLTGFFLDLPEMSGKQLQFLKEVKPDLARVAVLGDPRVNDMQFRAVEDAARSAGLTLQRLLIKSPNQIQEVIADAARQRAGALVALTSPLVNNYLGRIADAALKHRLPAICLFVPGFAAAGGLVAYGPDFPDLFRRAGSYVAMILKGAKPSELPVQRPTKFDLVINMKTAKALGLTIPQALLLRADQVIE